LGFEVQPFEHIELIEPLEPHKLQKHLKPLKPHKPINKKTAPKLGAVYTFEILFF
jgi:hypothetical protein